MANGNGLSFNINIFVVGVLVSVLLSAIGFSESDATMQWIVPGLVLVATLIAAMFIPEKRRKKAPPA